MSKIQRIFQSLPKQSTDSSMNWGAAKKKQNIFCAWHFSCRDLYVVQACTTRG